MLFKFCLNQLEIQTKTLEIIFNDENILRPINYYRLGSYWLSFERDHPTHKFKSNAQCKLGLSISQEISFRQSLKNIDKLII